MIKTTCLSFFLIAALLLSAGHADEIQDQTCDMAHENLQREAEKFIQAFEKASFSNAFPAIITMSYILPKL